MNFKISVLMASALAFSSSMSFAEEATYGEIDLTGLARNSWGYNAPGSDSAMVCNVNGPDGYLTIRNGPGSDYASNRKLNRLAILDIDTSDRDGHWVWVNTAYRTHTKNGRRLAKDKDLYVTGWAHDSYLCDFLD